MCFFEEKKKSGLYWFLPDKRKKEPLPDSNLVVEKRRKIDSTRNRKETGKSHSLKEVEPHPLIKTSLPGEGDKNSRKKKKNQIVSLPDRSKARSSKSDSRDALNHGSEESCPRQQTPSDNFGSETDAHNSNVSRSSSTSTSRPRSTSTSTSRPRSTSTSTSRPRSTSTSTSRPRSTSTSTSRPRSSSSSDGSSSTSSSDDSSSTSSSDDSSSTSSSDGSSSSSDDSSSTSSSDGSSSSSDDSSSTSSSDGSSSSSDDSISGWSFFGSKIMGSELYCVDSTSAHLGSKVGQSLSEDGTSFGTSTAFFRSLTRSTDKALQNTVEKSMVFTPSESSQGDLHHHQYFELTEQKENQRIENPGKSTAVNEIFPSASEQSFFPP